MLREPGVAVRPLGIHSSEGPVHFSCCNKHTGEPPISRRWQQHVSSEKSSIPLSESEMSSASSNVDSFELPLITSLVAQNAQLYIGPTKGGHIFVSYAAAAHADSLLRGEVNFAS